MQDLCANYRKVGLDEKWKRMLFNCSFEFAQFVDLYPESLGFRKKYLAIDSRYPKVGKPPCHKERMRGAILVSQSGVR